MPSNMSRDFSTGEIKYTNSEGVLHNIEGPALITPLWGGANRVKFYVQGKEMSRTEFYFWYPKAKR